MAFIAVIAVTLVVAFLLSKILSKGRRESKNLPGGSLGYPLIGETLSFLQAQKQDRGPQWLEERTAKHGPVFKTCLMGSPTVIVIGQAGNKFILGAEDDVLAAKQPPTLLAIGGKQSIFELTGSRGQDLHSCSTFCTASFQAFLWRSDLLPYRLVKGAMVSFLKPESLQNYINQMDKLIKTMLLKETENKDTIKAVVTMKKLTFNIASSILFGIKDENTRGVLFEDFSLAFKATWSLPINFPGTVYRRGLRARARIVDSILPILKERREEISKGNLSPTSDVFSSFLALRDENQEPVSDDLIMDNYVTLMIASHDTTAILLSLMIWKLSTDSEIYKKVLQEQIDITSKREGEEDRLTWQEIQKMKYTWRVAQELMRMIPPVFGSFRKILKDTQYGGYDIPKGWQVFWAAYGTHMNKEVFDKPTEFDPSRFENSSKPIPPYAYIPFGGGIHTCPGNEFARVEVLTTIHNLVTMFEWSQVYPEEKITRQPMPYPSMGLPIKIKPRIPKFV
ncbi:taxane 10-beta-hydroxylase-like isoform X2 [Rosa rugosa]|uniref:taxane 10-beta-hydroxylase-like isoform X2 n=1 Tax=Rosa rugosa TaxID=74645 RepID=UPI002B411152|nr:taxane 10-beta-hydroxylase-like isoform X2 [Rosa rugosa]